MILGYQNIGRFYISIAHLIEMQIAQTFQNLDEDPLGFLLLQMTLFLDKLPQFFPSDQLKHLMNRVGKFILEKFDSTHDIFMIESLKNSELFLMGIQFFLVIATSVFDRKTTSILKQTVKLVGNFVANLSLFLVLCRQRLVWVNIVF